MTKLDESKRASVRASDLLAAAAAIAAGTQAYAEPIRFDNPAPGGFGWGANRWLDITKAYWDQMPLEIGPSKVGQLRASYNYYQYHIAKAFTSGGADVVASPTITKNLSQSTVVDGSWQFSNHANHVVYSTGQHGTFVTTYFSNGSVGYMGVRFLDVDGYHYGWISVVRYGLNFSAFAWGYETEPGVGIIAGIPAPGTLAALAFGAVVTRRGRKRKDD
jgi:hypothetical protein